MSDFLRRTVRRAVGPRLDALGVAADGGGQSPMLNNRESVRRRVVVADLATAGAGR